jgi:hypothetical protein
VDVTVADVVSRLTGQRHQWHQTLDPGQTLDDGRLDLAQLALTHD